MTTDQRCETCGCSTRLSPGLNCPCPHHQPTPTPTSSLEEARTLAHNRLLNAILDLYDGGYSREDVKDWNTLIDNVYAVARAEVIREVEEAVVVLGESGVLDIYQRSRISTRLRALPQGGEGKA